MECREAGECTEAGCACPTKKVSQLRLQVLEQKSCANKLDMECAESDATAHAWSEELGASQSELDAAMCIVKQLYEEVKGALTDNEMPLTRMEALGDAATWQLEI